MNKSQVVAAVEIAKEIRNEVRQQNPSKNADEMLAMQRDTTLIYCAERTTSEIAELSERVSSLQHQLGGIAEEVRNR